LVPAPIFGVERVAPAPHNGQQLRIGRKLFEGGVELARDLRLNIIPLGTPALH
jgi:hypothetical protein